MQQARLESERIGLAHVEFRPYASEDRLLESLLAADALIATLRPGLQGLLWPSKLALMSQCRLPIAWVGPIDGAVVRFLQDHAQTGVFRPGDAESLVDWLMGLSSHQDPAQPSEVTVQVMRIREQGLHSWQGWLAQA